MYILLKYQYETDIYHHETDERIVIDYKVSNNLDELKTPSTTNDIVTIWPDGINQYIVFIDLSRVDEVKNNFYIEAIKLGKQCIREYNLIKILEK